MRILHVSEAFGGGVFEVIRVMAEGMAERGHSVAIAHGARPETPGAVREAVDRSVDVIPLPWGERSARAQLAAGRALRRTVNEVRPDVVHLHSSFAGAVGAVVIPRRVPAIYSPHAYSFCMSTLTRPRRAAAIAVERFVGRRTVITGAVSEHEGELARDTVRARRVAVVPNGLPELDHPPAQAAERRNVVVAMGRVLPQRQPEACARILGGVADLAEVAWLGGADELAAGRKELHAAGVRVSGWLSRDEAVERLAQATAYVHWTAWDGQPLSVLEAMARGVVVIASDIRPNRDLLGPRQAFKTEGEAIAFLRRVLQEPELHAELVEEQRRRGSRFGAHAMVKGWEAVYREAVAAGGR